MRVVPEAMTAAWEAEDKTGDRRPMVRATIQKGRLKRHFYDVSLHPGGDWEHQKHREGTFTSIVMGQVADVIEIRNIKSFTWSRSVNQDVAEATMTLLNSETVPIGGVDNSSTLNRFEQPGAYTYSRGEPGREPSPWGYPDNDRAWNGYLVPDRIVRTYEGYGTDLTVVPGRDPYLMPSGTWLIDEVSYEESGEITVKMRDLARLFHDQMVFPPCVPPQEYPLIFEKIRTQDVPARDAQGGSWKKLTRSNATARSSNTLYVGKGFTNAPHAEYVTGNGGVNGHHAKHVLDQPDNAYWLSAGQDGFWDWVWWEADLDNPEHMAALRLKTKNGPYRIFISLWDGQKWLGKKLLNYDVGTKEEKPDSVDLGLSIPFVATTIADANIEADVIFRRKYRDVRKVRISFRRLHDTHVGEHPFNAGLRSVSIYTANQYSDLGFGKGTIKKSVGNYRDYTDVVKWIAAWGGWHWDNKGDFVRLGPDDQVDLRYFAPDPVLPSGNVWGDFMNTGTAGVAALTADLFDKQPFADVIRYVADLTGFSFWVDETGGIVWRMPNLWSLGNYLSPSALGIRQRAGRTDEVIELNTDKHLLDYSTTMTSRNLRERIFVANTTGRMGTVVAGYTPYRVNFRRVAGWTDQNFETHDEAIVMADMIAARQMFDYRRGRPRINGNPAIQIDDQIRIFAPVTNETFYHYVESINSTLDMTTGEWTYDLETHWLGENPEDAWVIDVKEMRRPTKSYLATMGVVGPEHVEEPDPGLYDTPDWTPTPLPVFPSGTRLLGMFHPQGDVAVARWHLDLNRLPDIGSSYYLPENVDTLVKRETRRVNRGVYPLITMTTKGTTWLADIANGAGAGMGALNDYVDQLRQVSEANPNVTVRATLEGAWEARVRAKALKGAATNARVYADALGYFIQRCRSHAPLVSPGYWTEGTDTARTSAVMGHLTVAPDWIAINAFSDEMTIETFDEAVADDLARFRSPTGTYRADYVRLGSPPIGLGEFAVSTDRHTSAVVTAFYTNLRSRLQANDLAFAVAYNATKNGYQHTIDGNAYFAAERAFYDSLRSL